MSIASWKAEFYPVQAGEVTDPEEAFQHSYRKWQGLTNKNLRKHGLRFEDCGIFDCKQPGCMHIAYAEQCALCNVFSRSSCDGCPLNENGFNCLLRGSPYWQSISNNIAAPMLRAFRTVIARKAKQQIDASVELQMLETEFLRTVDKQTIAACTCFPVAVNAEEQATEQQHNTVAAAVLQKLKAGFMRDELIVFAVEALAGEYSLLVVCRKTAKIQTIEQVIAALKTAFSSWIRTDSGYRFALKAWPDLYARMYRKQNFTLREIIEEDILQVLLSTIHSVDLFESVTGFEQMLLNQELKIIVYRLDPSEVLPDDIPVVGDPVIYEI